jgi:tetratricopeptide (TPR) repeat protein
MTILDAVYGLGNFYIDQCKLDEAEKMYERALQGCEKALGRDHTLTLDTVNNMGILYPEQGKLDETEEMYKQVLQGYVECLGSNHPYCHSVSRVLAALSAHVQCLL